MNTSYHRVWNAANNAWIEVSDIVVGRDKHRRGGKSLRTKPLCRAIRLGMASLFASLLSPSVMAICSPGSPTSGATVTCSGVPLLLVPNTFSSAVSNLIVNIGAGTQMNTLPGGEVLNLSGNNITLNNAGIVDPSILGVVSVLSNGAVIGNTAASTVNINNAATTGVFRGTGGLLGLNLSTLNGMALNVTNGTGGTTNIVNNGTIDSSALLTLTLLPANTPVLAVQGGSQVNMVNSGSLVGRAAFEASPNPLSGNTFVNSGTITGSVSLGAGSTNTFTGVTGSTVSAGGGSGLSLGGLAGVNLTFAPTGQIDGGFAGNNTLILQNPTGVGGGTTGTGTASSATYINFNNLTLNSGTWTLQGPLVSGTTTLNGGVAQINNNLTLGSGTLTSSGGSLLASTNGLSLPNLITLGSGGLQVLGTNAMTLAGAITGAGGLTKNGTGQLILNGANTYVGNTILNGGSVQLGNSNSLGTGALNVNAAANLDSSADVALSNAVVLNANLTTVGSNALSLNGTVSGTGSLIKNGASNLTLAGTNTYLGATSLNNGTLTVGSDNAIGSGALNTAAGTTLDASIAVTLGNAINLGGNLVFGGTNALTLNGAVNGAGSLTKNGPAVLTLGGVNSFTGDTLVNSGTLNVSGSLASANVGVNSGATLNSNGTLLGALTIANGGHLGLSTGNTLSVGSLVLGSTSNLDVSLGTPSTTSLLNVGGNLTLAGALNVTDAGGFGTGVYRLIDYTGILTGAGLNVASVPASHSLTDLQVQTAVGNQVNLLVAAPGGNIRFWDGSQSTANGVVDGGTGSWNASSTNWTSVNGTLNQNFANNFAVFQGTAGNVTVDGTQSITGMQFATDGYNLLAGTGGQLIAVNGSGGTMPIRVDSNATATIGVAINGSGTLAKLDSGTLVLNGANSYTGGTLLNGGTLVVGSNTALGTGLVTAAAGTTLDSNTAVTLANAFSLTGDLNVAGTNALTLNGAISGTGGLIKNGTTSLTLGGSNSYLGNTALNAGGLILASNTALGSGVLNAAAGTTLDASSAVSINNAVNLAGNLNIVGSADLTWGGAVNGVGSLTKNGASNLTLNGANTYSGGTTLNAGSLIVGNGTALGLGAVTVGGTSTLDSNAALSLTNAMTLNANLTLAGSNNLTLGGVVSGAGSITKNGAADLILSADNSYTGPTTILGGTLQVGSGSTAGSLGTGAVKNNAALVFNRSDAHSISNTISGTGTVSQAGTGTLLLSGANTYTGGTTVSAGALQGNSDSLQGNITNNATVNFDQATAGSYAGVMSGTGGIFKLGTGNLTLSGINTLSGPTSVNAGTLTVSGSGSIANSAVTVNSGGTLSGSGTVGSTAIALGGSLAPNNSLGALSVNGNLSFAPGSIYRVQVDASGASSRVNATGAATINGGNVDVQAGAGNYAANTSYNIVNAAGGRTGNFASVSSNLAFFTPTLGYDANNVFLSLTRNTVPDGSGGSTPVSYGSVAESPNQKAIGDALQATAPGVGDMRTVLHAVDNLSAAQARAAFDTMSGAGLAALRRTGANFSSNFLNHLQGRLSSVQDGPANAIASSFSSLPRLLASNGQVSDWMRSMSDSPQKFSLADGGSGLSSADSNLSHGFWSRGFGSYQNTDGDGNAAASRLRSSGLIAGYDYDPNTRDGWRIGAAVMGGTARLATDNMESGKSRHFAVAAYGSYTTGLWRFNGSTSWGRGSNHMDRSVVVGSLNRTASADFSSNTLTAYGEANYSVPMKGWTLQPLAALSLSRNKYGAFTETGAGALNLEVAGQTVNLSKSLIGTLATIETGRVRFEPRIIWAHDFGDLNTPTTAQFQGATTATPFNTSSTTLTRDSLILGLGATGSISRGINLFTDLQIEHNSKQRNVAVLVGLRSRW